MIRLTLFALALTVVTCATAAAQSALPQNACTSDAMKLCPNVKPGEGRVIACLVKEKTKLTAGCTRLLTSMGALK